MANDPVLIAYAVSRRRSGKGVNYKRIGRAYRVSKTSPQNGASAMPVSAPRTNACGSSSAPTKAVRSRENGVKMGRKPILTSHQREEARRRLAKGETTRALAKSYGASRSTISRLA